MNSLIVSPKRDLTALHNEVCNALVSMQNTINLYDRHNTNAQTSMVIAGEYTPARKLRQVAAELQKKQMALVEAYGKVRKKSLRAKMKREEAQKEEDDQKRELLECEADILESECALTERPYHGALQAVMRLKKIHDEILKDMEEKYGEVTDEVIEREEARYFIKRIFSQSLRNIRQYGNIQDGNQFVLVRMGFDPSTVQKMLSDWLIERSTNEDLTSKPEEDFLEWCADKFEKLVQPRLGYLENSE